MCVIVIIYLDVKHTHIHNTHMHLINQSVYMFNHFYTAKYLWENTIIMFWIYITFDDKNITIIIVWQSTSELDTLCCAHGFSEQRDGYWLAHSTCWNTIQHISCTIQYKNVSCHQCLVHGLCWHSHCWKIHNSEVLSWGHQVNIKALIMEIKTVEKSTQMV